MPADFNVYANYAKAVVQHFGANLAGVEIWNEPNVINFWRPAPDASAYTSMLKLAYTAVKSVDPNMLVLSRGTSPACTCGANISPVDFVGGLYAPGAKNSFDTLPHHPYSFPAPPADIQAWSGWSQIEDTNPSIRSVMSSNGDSNRPLWMTEVGTPTSGPQAIATNTDYNYAGGTDHVDECLQPLIYGQVLSRSKAASWSGVTFFYLYLDDGTDTATNEKLLRSHSQQWQS